MNAREMAENNTIIRCVVGSTMHGLNVQDGVEDRDEMGVCIEDINYCVGLNGFEQVVYRTAEEREGQGARSMAGDLDLTIYSLRKYVRLALKGNPTIISLLFIPRSSWISGDARGEHLQELKPYILSKACIGAFLGYLKAQKERLLGERGQKRIHRPELVEAYGYDTKYAMHMLRLGYQGIELAETGSMSFPMREQERSYLLDVRNGKIPYNDCLTRAGELDVQLKDCYENTVLPNKPDHKIVEDWMVTTYFEAWKARHTDD